MVLMPKKNTDTRIVFEELHLHIRAVYLVVIE